MTNQISYDKDFRCIGQALEDKDIHVFEIRWLGECYVVRGGPFGEGSPQSKLHKFSLGFRSGSQAEPLTLGRPEIEELARKGRAQRFRPGRMPEFSRLSNTLRIVGAYLQAKEAQLVELKVRPFSINLSYRDTDGQLHAEDRTIHSFHSLFLELYGKRHEAQSATPAKAPELETLKT
ncbi:MAG: hypothetical protein ABW172_01760 [Candidatus Binatia bacterium]